MTLTHMPSELTLQAGMLAADMTPEQVRDRTTRVGDGHAHTVAGIITGATPPGTHRELMGWCWVAATLGGWHCRREVRVWCSDGKAGHIDLVLEKGERTILVEIKSKPHVVEAASQLRRYASKWDAQPELMIVCPNPPTSSWGEDTSNAITVMGPSEFARLFADRVLRSLPKGFMEVAA